MNGNKFKSEAVKAVEALLGDGLIMHIDWHGDNSADFQVLEGGYEPARIRAWESNGSVMLGYR